ncbi:hypothetical protein RUM43_008351 [Polyplax serrata]|uniref:Uncharacterized protein n=1 Tax=Polyplax serrata TaxID=468196 RepID=A0AAN8P309_POLSC
MRWLIFVQYLAILILESLPTFTAIRRDEMCRFPGKWEGTWFQSGVRSPITIEMNQLSSKGRCLASDGDKFLVVDDKSVCYRCIVIHEKHINVLQYKETFCHDRNNLYNLCSLITGDALLYSMFRLNAQPVHCPFKPPMTFTYSRGHGECKNPVSSLDGCIEESRIVLRYQACPDVSGTESAVEELECVATWKEGSSRYLVGKVSHSHITSNEDRFRCFVYEKANPLQGNENTLNRNEGYNTFLSGEYGTSSKNHENFDFRLAQSGDATCNGLFSPMEGSRTMALKKAPIPNKCKYPGWLTYFQHWHTLDYRKSYTFHHRNTTLKISNNSAVDMSHSGAVSDASDFMALATGKKTFLTENGEIRLVCSEIKSLNHSSVNVVAHFTVGCQSGYVCLWFYRRDIHVIEVQSGPTTRRIEDACHPSHFESNTPFITLVTTNPEPRECPYGGKFSVAGISQMERQKRSPVTNPKAISNLNIEEYQINRMGSQGGRKRRRRNDQDKEEPCEDEVTTLEVGCNNIDSLEFRSQCSSSSVISEYSCHGRWTENDTNFLITTPQSRTSIGAKRYCFIYKEVGSIIHFSSSSQSCVRNINTGVEGVLAFNATKIDDAKNMTAS